MELWSFIKSFTPLECRKEWNMVNMAGTANIRQYAYKSFVNVSDLAISCSTWKQCYANTVKESK